MVTKAEAKEARECATELLNAIPKSKKADAFGAANELFLFIDKVEREAVDAPVEAAVEG